MIAGILAPALGRGRGGADGAIRDLQLVERRSPGKLLDGGPVEVAGCKIHLREIAAFGEHGVDQRHAFEDDRPVDIGDVPHAGDDVAHRDVGGDLPLLLVVDGAVARPSVRRQAFVEPAEHCGKGRALIPQPVDQLKRQRIGRRSASEPVDQLVFRLPWPSALSRSSAIASALRRSSRL